MIGERLDRLAQRIVRERYRLRVAPAIADLQHEAASGAFARARGYVGVWRALGRAMADDLALDLVATCRSGALPATTVTLVTLSCIVVPQLVLLLGERAPASPWHYWFTYAVLWVPSLIGYAAPATLVATGASLAMHGPRARVGGALLATIAAGSVLVGGATALDRVASDLRRDFMFAALFAHGDQALAGRPLWELRDIFLPRLRALPSGPRGTSRPVDAAAAAIALTMVASTMVGIAMRRRRTVFAVGAAVGLFVIQLVVHRSTFALSLRLIFGPAIAALFFPVLFLLVASLVAIRSGRTQA